MAEDSDLERTEAPTGRRIEKAREEGQVPRSRELGSFLVLIGGAVVLWKLGPWSANHLLQVFRGGFMIDAATAREPERMLAHLASASYEGFLALAPLLAVVTVAAFLAPFLLNSWNFAPKAFQPDLMRLDPLSGLKRIISINGLTELVKAVAKASIIGGVAVWVVWRELDEITALLAMPLETGLADAMHLLGWSFLVMVTAMIIVVAADVPYQIWHFYDQLKMTKDEVKQEGKEMDGSPEVKAKIRQKQREAARRRMMSSVPTADVIVTNPTHFAVALSYKAGMGAPVVVAKGLGELALKIRELGAESGVPLLEAPPLARALYKHVELEQEIPAPLYTAVAEVLAWVYQITRYRREGGAYPLPPRDLPIPEALVPPPVPA